MADTPFTPKGFFQRPEGKAGLVLPVIVGAAVLFFFGSTIGDFVVNAVDNILHLTVVVAALAAIAFVLFDPNVRTLALYSYKSVMRTLTGLFIEIDPIGVLKTYQKQLASKLGEMDNSISLLNGERTKIERLLAKNTADIDKSMGLVVQAVKVGDNRVQALEGKQATRLTNENTRIGGDYNRIRFLIEVLGKYRTLSQDTITDMGREIDSKVRERNYSKASQSAIRSAMGILKGLPNEHEMYEQSLELLEQQYSDAIGEVDHFLSITKDIISSSDLQSGADSEKALHLLEEWQKKSGGVMFGGANGMSKTDIIADARKQLVAAPIRTNTFAALTSGKPQYEAVAIQTDDADDYLTMVKK